MHLEAGKSLAIVGKPFLREMPPWMYLNLEEHRFEANLRYNETKNGLYPV